jgi:hypothetical protein
VAPFSNRLDRIARIRVCMCNPCYRSVTLGQSRLGRSLRSAMAGCHPRFWLPGESLGSNADLLRPLSQRKAFPDCILGRLDGDTPRGPLGRFLAFDQRNYLGIHSDHLLDNVTTT